MFLNSSLALRALIKSGSSDLMYPSDSKFKHSGFLSASRFAFSNCSNASFISTFNKMQALAYKNLYFCFSSSERFSCWMLFNVFNASSQSITTVSLSSFSSEISAKYILA